MAAAVEAGLPLRLNIVLTKTNAHEQDAMIAMAERWGLRYLVYSNDAACFLIRAMAAGHRASQAEALAAPVPGLAAGPGRRH